ncbi:MAG: hypothetical protein J6C05_08680 [Prevotella sp.]|nr:hypothetical protein [Prevotella sp.]
MELGDGRTNKSQVILLAKHFDVDEKEILTLWLADKIWDTLEDEDKLRLKAIEVTKSKLMDVNR